MNQDNIQFVRKYSRQSKSPFDDVSTSLWLADIASEEGEELKLDFSRYIYVHRDGCGRIVGVSVSKSIVADHPGLDSQYLSGSEMYALLLFYIDEIESFCGLWADEFESFFLLPPDLFFEIAGWRWNAIVVKEDC